MTASASVAYRFNGFCVDPVRRLLSRADGEPIPLKPKVFDVLLCLVERPGELVPKEELLKSVWPHVIVEENNLNKAISTLRQVFGETRDEHRFIVTEPGRGYRFVASVVVVQDVRDVPPEAQHTGRQPSLPPTTGQDALVTVPSKERRKAVHRATLVAGAAAFIVVGLLSVLVSQSMRPRPAPAIGTAIRISPVTTYPGNEFGPAVSPDGSRAAFMWNDGTERTQIYVAPIGPGAPQRLSRGEIGNDRDPAWSPDSNWIAFLREHDPTRLDLMVIPSFGGQERKLASVRVASLTSLDGFPLIAWTPDSRSILFTTQREGSETAPAHGFICSSSPPERLESSTPRSVRKTTTHRRPFRRTVGGSRLRAITLANDSLT
jgi:DNA-binding winged helix-turn-helix (wHTH) protein